MGKEIEAPQTSLASGLTASVRRGVELEPLSRVFVVRADLIPCPSLKPFLELPHCRTQCLDFQLPVPWGSLVAQW